ncbi:hypothetical protein SD78_3129 [Bacillus badius]|nr:hypothetical protein SD78_3129 [Bacillus badius]
MLALAGGGNSLDYDEPEEAGYSFQLNKTEKGVRIRLSEPLLLTS